MAKGKRSEEEVRGNLLAQIKNLVKDINKLQEIGVKNDTVQKEILDEKLEKLKKVQQEYKQLRDAQRKVLDSTKAENDSLSQMFTNISKLPEATGRFRESMIGNVQISKEINDSIATLKGGVGGAAANVTALSKGFVTATESIAELADLNSEDQYAIIAKNAEIEKSISFMQDQLDLAVAKLGSDNETVKLMDASLGKLRAQLSMANQFAGLSEETKELYKELHEDLESINKTFKKISTTAEIFFSSFQNAIGLAFVGAGHLFEKFEEINEQIGGWGFQLGQFKMQAMLVTEILGEEAGKATISLGQKLGNVNDVTLGTSLNAGFLAHNLGLSGDEAATVITQFGRLQGLSNDTGLNMAAATKELALQNGVAPRQVMQDIAKNGEAFALFSKDGGKNMAEAAVAAAKLGSDLGTASKMSENLLDYNSSVEKEMNASVLLGRDLNLGKARELAYANDIAGAQKAALEAVGGAQEFNKMDYYQKKAVADALGVSVQELQTMGANMEHNNTLTGELEGTFSSLNEGAEALTGTFGGTLLKGIGGALIGVKGMKDNIADAKEGASFLKDSFTGIKGLFSGKGMKGFSGILESKEQKSIGGLGDKLGGKGGADAGGGKGPSEAMKGGSKINMNDAIKGAAAMLIMAAAIFVLAKALQEFNTVNWSSLAKAGAALLGLGIGIWVITKMLAGLAEDGILFLVAAGVLIFAAALYVMGAGAKLFAEAFALISTSLSAFASGLSGLDVGKLALLGLALIPLGIGLMIAAPGLIYGSIGLLALGGAMALLGPSMLNFSASMAGLDVGKLALLGLALIPLGIGLMLAAPGLIIGSVGLMLLATAMAALAPALSLLSTVMPAIVANLTPLVGMIMQIFGLAAAITALSISLAMLGTMGALALPVLAGLALGGGLLMTLMGGGGGGKSDSSDKLLEEIQGLRQDMSDGKIGVYLDGKKMNTGLAISNKRQPS
jgi:hypothetical protein